MGQDDDGSPLQLEMETTATTTTTTSDHLPHRQQHAAAPAGLVSSSLCIFVFFFCFYFSCFFFGIFLFFWVVGKCQEKNTTNGDGVGVGGQHSTAATFIRQNGLLNRLPRRPLAASQARCTLLQRRSYQVAQLLSGPSPFLEPTPTPHDFSSNGSYN